MVHEADQYRKADEKRRDELGRLGAGHAGAAKWLGYVDKFALFPPELRRAMAWADLVHVCDQGNAMYMRYLQNKPHLLTCHDVLAIRSALGDVPEWLRARRAGSTSG